jgi:hypothetical protein
MKTKKTLLLLISLSIFAVFQLHAQTPGFEWAGQMGGDSLIQASSVAVDAAGNQVIIGSFRNTVDFDPSPTSTYNITAKGYSDIFLQKLDANGALLWAASIGDTFNMNERGAEVVTDAAGNIYATGYFWGTTDVDPGDGVYFLSQNRWTTMVLKINPDGDLIWGKQMGSETAGHAYGRSIAVDNSGNVITSGSFYGRVDFDPGPGVVNLTCTSNDVFVQKLDANGNFMWVKQLVGTDYKFPYCMATDVSGNIYTCGYFMGTVDFNPDRKLKYNLTSFGDYDIFVLKLTGNGDFGYAKQIGGTGQDLCYSIDLDPAGYLYTTGQFNGTADFNPGTGTYNLTSFGGNDAYVLKLGLSGNFVWVKQIGGPSYDSGCDIVLDDEGNFYVSGFFYATADFDPGAGTYYLTANGNADGYILKSDLDGNLIWVIQTGGPGWDFSLTMGLDGSGNIFNVGRFEETVDFDPGGNSEFELSNVGVYDMFVQKLNPSGGDNCPAPNGLVAGNITQTSADLSWNAVTSAGGYYVRYREVDAEWIYSGLLTGLNLSIDGLNPLSANEFQVKTDCQSNFSYSHGFNTLGTGCPDNYEPNESMGTAVTIPVNTDITALIATSADVDWFKFTTTSAAKNIHVTLTSLPANYNIYLYKSDGTVIGSSLNPDLQDESIIYNNNKIGTYYIRVYGSGGVYDLADCYTLHVATSSTQYAKSAQVDMQPVNKTSGLTLYPNPARNVLNIDYNSNAAGKVTMTLVSITGQVILEQELPAGEGQNHHTLNLDGITNGLYMIKLTREGESTLSKFMINR